MGGWEAFLLGCAGGFLAELSAVLPYRKIRRKKHPHWMTSGFYWFWALVLIPIAGFFGWAGFDGVDVAAWVVVQAGATTPLIIERISALGADIPSAGSVS